MPAQLVIDLEEFSRSVPSRDNVRTAPADEWIRTVRGIASITQVSAPCSRHQEAQSTSLGRMPSSTEAASNQTHAYRDRRRIRLLVVAGGVLATLGCSSQPRSVAASRAEPVALMGLGEADVLRWPSVTIRSDTAFVAANAFVGDSTFTRPLYLGRAVEIGGVLVPLAPLPLPPGDFQFAYPRLAATDHALHLVWAEFDSPPRTSIEWESPTNRATSLWHATFEDEHWSSPERIAAAFTFGWNAERGGLAVDASGTVHVAAGKGDIDTVPHVHDFHLMGGRWSDTSFPYTGLNESSAIATRGDTAILAAVDEVHDTARVMVVASTDHGTHWSHPIVASSRYRFTGTVSRLAFAWTSDGFILAVGEKANDSFYLDAIRVVHLSASARSPTTTFIDPPHAVDGFELTGTPCGSPLMVLRTLSTAPRLLQLVLDDARAARNLDPLLGSAAVAMFPGLAANARSVLAAFGYAAAADFAWHAVIMPLSPCAESNGPSRRGEIDLSSAAEGSFALRAQDDARVSSAAEGSFASLRMTCGAQRRKRRQFARGDSWQWPTHPMASFGSIASPPIVSP